MKWQLLKKLPAFIVTVMMFSAIPELVNAQKDNRLKERKIRLCNCNIRPIPFQCGQTCGWLVETRSISGTNSSAVQFELSESQNVSIKIYDATWTLVRTLSNDKITPERHQIEWDRKDTQGNTVSAGIYIIQLNAGGKTETRKLSVVS